jgi:hypothetical protein
MISAIIIVQLVVAHRVRNGRRDNWPQYQRHIEKGICLFFFWDDFLFVVSGLGKFQIKMNGLDMDL